MDTAYLSEPHRLIVHEHPEDGFEILHPDSCERYEGEIPGFTYVRHECAVAWHVDGLGLDHDVWHAFNPSDEEFRFTETYQLLPGTYTLRVEVVRIYAYEFGAYEYNSTVWIEPQAALPGPAPDPRDWSAYVDEYGYG